jgi:hypothetical protein
MTFYRKNIQWDPGQSPLSVDVLPGNITKEELWKRCEADLIKKCRRTAGM